MALTQMWEKRWDNRHQRVVCLVGAGAGTAGVGAVNDTWSPFTCFMLDEIRITIDGAVNESENFVVKVDSGSSIVSPAVASAKFDAIIYSVDPSVAIAAGGAIQHNWDPMRIFGEGDKVDIDYTNTDDNVITYELIVRLPY